jgi:hypothetical protein
MSRVIRLVEGLVKAVSNDQRIVNQYRPSRLTRNPALQRRPCASLALHLLQVEQGTSTPKLLNLFGTRKRESRTSLLSQSRFTFLDFSGPVRH